MRPHCGPAVRTKDVSAKEHLLQGVELCILGIWMIKT